MRYLIILILALSVFVFWCTNSDPRSGCDGFVTNNYKQSILWRTQDPIVLIIHPNIPQKYHKAIYNAAKVWDDSIGHKVFNIIPGTDETLPAHTLMDGKNVISFNLNWESDKTSEQGRTSVFWNDDHISEVDIMINTRDFKYYSQLNPKDTVGGVNAISDNYNLETLFIHEMGHALGLAHRDGTVMSTHLLANEERTTLTFKDSNSVKCGYSPKVEEVKMASIKAVK